MTSHYTPHMVGLLQNLQPVKKKTTILGLYQQTNEITHTQI